MTGDQSITPERIQRGLLIVAYAMEKHGAVLAPLYERLEAELQAATRRETTLDRARRMLEANTLNAGTVRTLR